MNSPVFSIVLPVYNRAKTVKRAVESVLGQSFLDFELLLVDDHSSDNSLSVLNSFSDSRVIVLATPENRGPAAARNEAIKVSRGSYISFLDSDDAYEATFLEKSFNKLRNTTDKVGFIWTGVTFVNSSRGENMVKYNAWTPKIIENEYRTFLNALHIGTNCGVTIKKEVFDTVGLFDDSLLAAEDTDLFLRVARKYQFDYVHEPLIRIYRNDQDRLSKQFDKIAIAYHTIIAKNLEEISKYRELRVKYYYKMQWLSYHTRNASQARRYFKEVLKDSPFHLKSWITAFLFEILGYRLGREIHLKSSR